MTQIDPAACAALLRESTDRIAARTDRPSPQAEIGAVVAWVRALSREAGQALRARLEDLYPGIGWVAEEGRPQAADALYWVHDPIDGAYHFLQGLPLWSSSLVLMQGERPVFALVYDPSSGELFSAQAGLGATLNGAALHVCAKSDLAAAVLGTAVPPIAQVGPGEHARALALLGVVARQAFVVRQMASASLQLAYVAADRLDGYWEVGEDTPDWLAGALLVREAGGRVTDLAGAELTWTGDGVLAAAPPMHASLRAALAGT
jgi:myo-inositol-1(or 4)-monophosphatase